VNPRLRSWALAFAVALPIASAAEASAAALARFSLRLSEFTRNNPPSPAPASGEAVIEDGLPRGQSKLLNSKSLYDGTSTARCDIGMATFVGINRRRVRPRRRRVRAVSSARSIAVSSLASARVVSLHVIGC
jgi:hypothetical protein